MADTSILVRMYRVGFGDCFLIRFPGPCHLLVDCGSLAGAKAEVPLDRVVKDIEKRTRGCLDVVAVSHRHADHLNGFSRQARTWSQFEVGEVWLPWMEDPRHGGASVLRRRQDAIARELGRRSKGHGSLLARNSVSDEIAMDVLLGGFRGSPRIRYLAADPLDMLSERLPGVHVRVLGPERSDSWITRTGVECALAELTSKGEVGPGSPFPPVWQLSQREGRSLFAAEIRRRPLVLDPTDGIVEHLCYWLDKSINNTSLVLLLRLGRTRLLLAGDAEGEVWLPLMAAEDVMGALRSVDLLKVAHHGSHNGTPPRVLEAIGPVRSMVSTASGISERLPDAELLKALGRSGPLVRSDRPSRRRARVDSLAVEVELKAF